MPAKAPFKVHWHCQGGKVALDRDGPNILRGEQQLPEISLISEAITDCSVTNLNGLTLLYRIWPQTLNAMVLVKPAPSSDGIVRDRLYWRWRSRARGPGRPKMSSDIRDLIRQMCCANPLWGAPRVHGELLKLGIEISQAAVGRYTLWRPKDPSPTWRSFLHHHMHCLAAIDMFVVVTATFLLLYALIVLGHDRRKVIHFEVTENPTQDWLARQLTEAFP